MDTPEPRISPDDDPCEACVKHEEDACPFDYYRHACEEALELCAADMAYDLTV